MGWWGVGKEEMVGCYVFVWQDLSDSFLPLLPSLPLVDISRNALGFNCISRLQCCAKARKVEMNVEGT